MALLITLLLALPAQCWGHGQIVLPPPRNAIDSEDPAQAHATYPDHGHACPVPNGKGGTSGKNGQACYWFSNGASIGCAKPDGTTRGPIPNINCTQEGEMCRRKMDVCGSKAKASICDPALRTVNTAAECGADDDWYYYSPWRSPGSAGIFDSCGMAGGTPKKGEFGGAYVTTKHAKQGDLGSRTLPPRASGTVWAAGSVVEVSWNLLANHGGGYQYRLCPASKPLTEDCFFKTPLPFVGRQSFRWDAKDGQGGTQVWLNGTYVSEGTLPKGSVWAKNPVPRNDTAQTGASFPPLCEEVPDCGDAARESRCFCSGMWGPYNLEIVDKVQIPKDLPPGDYVVGWRWDCEESNQIWTSCSDVTVVPPQDGILV